MFNDDFTYTYCPILAISPSEINAIRELPKSDKDAILPIFPIKSWASAHQLSNAIEKVQESLGESNYWIATVDYEELNNRPKDKYRDVHRDIEKLIDPTDGYSNWCTFIGKHDKLIPCLQTKELKHFELQVQYFNSLERGTVLILRQPDIQSGLIERIVEELKKVTELLIIVDLEQINERQVSQKQQVIDYLLLIKKLIPNALVSLSSTSFPDSFGGYYKGTKSIYERALFDKVREQVEGLIYSDRGSARANKLAGGGGTPPPRIDYACKNEWHFVRKEFSDYADSLSGEAKKRAVKAEKKKLYTEIANVIISQEYWENDLALYSNYLIELTSKGDEYGVDSAQKATAARINKHLHTQLHYDFHEGDVDTDEDWID